VHHTQNTNIFIFDIFASVTPDHERQCREEHRQTAEKRYFFAQEAAFTPLQQAACPSTRLYIGHNTWSAQVGEQHHARAPLVCTMLG
jgi:hypothetical protein